MNHETTKKTIEELLSAMGVRFTAVNYADSPGASHVCFTIESDDSALLIGGKGENLGALNYVVRKIAAKAAGPGAGKDTVKFFVDVNGYHAKALDSIKTKAQIMSERARSFKVDTELEPMSSYERMLIHSYLEGAPDIKTESVGEGPARRIVIKYVGGSAGEEL